MDIFTPITNFDVVVVGDIVRQEFKYHGKWTLSCLFVVEKVNTYRPTRIEASLWGLRYEKFFGQESLREEKHLFRNRLPEFRYSVLVQD